MCEKVPYDSFSRAQTVVNKANNYGRHHNRRMANKIPKRVYKCPVCESYHLTSLKKPNKTKRYK